MKKTMILFAVVFAAILCVSPFLLFSSKDGRIPTQAEESSIPKMEDKDRSSSEVSQNKPDDQPIAEPIPTENETRPTQEEEPSAQEAEDESTADDSSLPDKSVLYRQLINSRREQMDKFESEHNGKKARFYPREDAVNAESLGLLPPKIYNKTVTVDLEKGGKLILGCDCDESSSILYLNPRVMKEDDPEGTQYGFYLPKGYLYMDFNRPDPDAPLGKVSLLDSFRSLEVYDLNGEPLAQYDNGTIQFGTFPGQERKGFPSTNFFINNRTYDFIPCDGGARFGPCYFHCIGDSELLPSDPREREVCVAFETWMVIVRLSDGEILDIVGAWLKETEFNVFELSAISLTTDFKLGW